MKKILSAILFLAVALVACGQPADVAVIYDGSTPRALVWTAPTEDVEGNPLLPEDVLEYRIYVCRWPMAENEPELIADAVILPEGTIDISGYPRGYYYIGVSAYSAGDVSTESEVCWSNDSILLDPTQRFAYLVTGTLYPAAPTGLQTLP